MTDRSYPNADPDLVALQVRALRQRQRHTRALHFSATINTLAGAAQQFALQQRAVPMRYVLHLLVALLVPLAIVAAQLPHAPQSVVVEQPVTPDTATTDLIVPVAPLSLDTEMAEETPPPDAAFADIDALRMPAFLPHMLDAPTFPAAVIAEIANVRGGPGTNYDKIGTLSIGTPLRVIARVQDWYQAQMDDGHIIWITAELLDLDAPTADLLPQARNIPAPPPPKIGLVSEEGLNLRDGPGTDYVGMTKLPSGLQLDLIARYQDWFQVQTPEGQAGWVLGQYLNVGPGVIERLEVVSTVSDPNPALVGAIRERNVNLRGGPGIAYPKIGAMSTGLELDLLGRYQDWFKVRTPRGATGWVSNELIDVSAFVARRVPVARDIPALPRPKPAAQPQVAPAQRGPIPAPSAYAGNAVDLAAQFVGARYVWGGASPSGFDCSGFTMYVYKQFGLSLPHSAAGQYSTKYGTIISTPSDLRPGDLVFFVNTYKRGISHVGIYIGNGNVVQALTPKLGVGVANVNDRYWSQHYYGAIRPAL